MFKNIKEFFQFIIKSRLLIAGTVMTLLFSILVVRMFQLQIVKGEKYQDNYTLKIVKERTLNSTRGRILDRNGEVLAYNELAYSITIEDNGSYDSTKERDRLLNAELAQIIEALEKNGDSIVNNFKITLDENDNYSFTVSGTALKRFLADAFGQSSYSDLKYDKTLGFNQAEATAEQVMQYLKTSRFRISSDYEEAMAYKIAVLRYAMSENSYQKYISTTIAADVSEESVAYVSENASSLQGVEVIDDTVRKYDYPEYFASILGYTGKISNEEFESLSEGNDNYSLNDVVGKAGIEQVMDATLQGSKGYEKLYVDHLGKAIEVIDREEPAAGNDVYLSIDKNLQIAAYDLLEQEIAGIVYSNIENAGSEMRIPITDVYFALINNNIIDIDHFTDADASENESAVYQIFESRQQSVFSSIRNELTGPTPTAFGSLDTESQDYFTYIISQLKENNVLLDKSIDKTDSVYQSWQAGTISAAEYLNHAIAMNWIDITQFTLDEKYSDSTEIFDSLCNYIMDDIATEKGFSKIIYEYLINSGSISGKQLCLILFDQGVLSYDAEDIQSLNSGAVGAAGFLKEKIKNLEITPAQLALDPCSGSCVITDTKTGELLALVSYPGYDNNRLANTVDAAYFASLNSDLSKPLYNYATQEKTAPGSTFKMVSSVAGLATGMITPNTQIMDKGIYENISNHPRCWALNHGYTHGLINVSEALRDSCNYFFYDVGYRLSTNNYTTNYDDATGIARLTEYASELGLDDTTGIEIEENSPKIATEFPVMAAIGQSNNNYATIQLGRYVTAIANSGTVYQYTLLSKVCDSDGNILESYEPKVRNTVTALDTSGWDAIHSGMRMVVENLSTFNDFPVEVAGKTGTAQQNPKRPNHALFVGYAPYNDPQISIATRIAFGYTSHNAAEYAKNVFAYYFNIEDSEDLLNGQAANVGESSNSFND